MNVCGVIRDVYERRVYYLVVDGVLRRVIYMIGISVKIVDEEGRYVIFFDDVGCFVVMLMYEFGWFIGVVGFEFIGGYDDRGDVEFFED